jgi:hypothetical protein
MRPSIPRRPDSTDLVVFAEESHVVMQTAVNRSFCGHNYSETALIHKNKPKRLFTCEECREWFKN